MYSYFRNMLYHYNNYFINNLIKVWGILVSKHLLLVLPITISKYSIYLSQSALVSNAYCYRMNVITILVE